MPKTVEIALINLMSRTNDWDHIVMVPLGLMSIAAAAKEAFGDRISVRLLDMALGPPGVPPETALRARLEERPPDLVGIRGFTSQAAEFPRAARVAKAVNPACLVVAGGPHASTGARDLHEAAGVDLVAPGEGEETFVDVVRNVLEGRDPSSTPGIARWADGARSGPEPRPLIADLDRLPCPDHSLVDLNRYQGGITMTDFHSKGRYTVLFTSRGCPYRCTYCHDHFGKRVRYRGVRSVIDEMARLIGEHGVEEFHIVDDIFNADERRAIAIFDEIVRRNWRIWLAFPNGLRGDIMTEEFVAAARAAGTYHWALAVETAAARLQKRIRKFNDLDRLRETIALADRHGVFTATFNMLGFETETEEEMLATIEYTVESAAHDTQIFVVTPFEGTALFEALSARGTPAAPARRFRGYTDFTGPSPSISGVPRSRLEALIVEANRRFFFREPTRIRRMIDLAPRGHGYASLAFHLCRRLHTAGLTLQTVAEPVAAALSDLFAKAAPPAPEWDGQARGPTARTPGPDRRNQGR